MKKGRITVVMTGGTIGSTVEGSSIDLSSSPVIINEYKKIYGSDVEFDVLRPFEMLSENSIPKVWEKLGRTLHNCEYDNDGIIITHGTDTLAYTSAYISMIFGGMQKPVVLVSSNFPIGTENSNGLDNFRSAVELIENESIAGIFVIYRDNRGRNIVHLGSRLTESDTFTDQFYSYGGCPYGEMDTGHFIRYANAVNPKAFMLKTMENTEITSLKNQVFMIRPYPGIDYSSFEFKNKPKAILHCMYHSGTACVRDGCYSLPEFIKRCKNEGIDTYLSCYKSPDGAKYATAVEIISAGGIPLYNISNEAAYVKLVLAYNQNKISPEEFMDKNIYFEILK